MVYRFDGGTVLVKYQEEDPRTRLTRCSVSAEFRSMPAQSASKEAKCNKDNRGGLRHTLLCWSNGVGDSSRSRRKYRQRAIAYPVEIKNKQGVGSSRIAGADDRAQIGGIGQKERELIGSPLVGKLVGTRQRK